MTIPTNTSNRAREGSTREVAAAIHARAAAPARPRKTAMLLAQRIVDEIADNLLPAGTPLLSEAKMLEKYGIARGTLREALRFLEMQGVVTIKTGPGGGAVVADPGSQPLASVIGLLLQLSHTSFRSIVDARLEFEPMLARKAASSRTDDDLEVLAQSIDDMVASIGEGRLFLVHNEIFHTTIARAAGNPVLLHFAASLAWIEDGTVLGIDYAESARKPVVAAHRRIYKAIEAGDEDMAETAMRLHAKAFAKYAEENFARILDQPLRWDQVRP
jgi:DNA-binding FadR family transcriptional regulator